jgi:hypothetical protein
VYDRTCILWFMDLYQYATMVTARRGADHLVASFAANAAWGSCGAGSTPHDGQKGAIRYPHSSFPSSALPSLTPPSRLTPSRMPPLVLCRPAVSEGERDAPDDNIATQWPAFLTNAVGTRPCACTEAAPRASRSSLFTDTPGHQ